MTFIDTPHLIRVLRDVLSLIRVSSSVHVLGLVFHGEVKK